MWHDETSRLLVLGAEQLVKNGYLADVTVEAAKPRDVLVLISTSKGVMTGAEAVKAKLGGELLLKVY